MKQIFPIDASNYERHRIHTQERNWAETNCYVDVWIELLHGWGFEPIAALPFTIGIDFEGDQWTFFKFPLSDLRELYGLDVQELALWRPPAAHLEEQIGRGRPVLIELDSYYLPDTVGTAYQLQHQKTTVAAVKIDAPNRLLGYFHGQGYYELKDEDFDRALRVHGLSHPDILPPYAEFVKLREGEALTGDALVRKSLELLRKHLQSLPVTNPFGPFKDCFEFDLNWLMTQSLDVFHQYSFATLRQLGACYECSATYLNWLSSHGVEGLESSANDFTELSTGARTLQFHLARAMARKKPIDLGVLDQMGATWESALERLQTVCGEACPQR
jgi:hypothetical protein